MTTVTSQQITQFRAELVNFPDAMKALEAIEDCEGNLEDAAIALAIRAGQQPQRDNAEWLDALARKCRAVICQKGFRQELLNGSYAPMVRYLTETPLLPGILITPVLMYVVSKGVDSFCAPLDEVPLEWE